MPARQDARRLSAELLKRVEALEVSAAGSVHEEERGNNRHNHQKIAFGVSKLLT
jgi:hypothetical protein